jgi:hypothetical protein
MLGSLMVRLVMVAVIAFATASTSSAQDQLDLASSASADPDYAPLIDSVEADLLASVADLIRYKVAAQFEPATATSNARLTGTLQVDYRNHTGAPLSEIYFRLYPNSAEYVDGDMSLNRFRVGGTAVSGDLSQDDTLLTLPLPNQLAEGETIQIRMNFETVLPTDPEQSYGMFQFDTGSNTYALAHWMPLLSGWDAVYGWNIGPVSQNGDPVYTESAVFDVTLTSPAEFMFVTSGSLLSERVDGPNRQAVYASGPSRDFAMAASTDFQMIETHVGETTVRSYALPGYEEGAELVLASGAKSLATYSDLIGAYPYEEMDLVQVDIGNGAGGVEFPGLVFIGSGYYDPASLSRGSPGILEFVVVHEIAHQWFYNVIGNNQYQHAFLDESLSNYLSIVHFTVEYGAESADQVANLHLRLGYFNPLFQEGDQVVDQPTDDFNTMQSYGIFVYGKGALAFIELRRQLGAEAFFGGLHLYYRDFAFKIAQPEDLKNSFEASSGSDLDEFWSHWFEEAAGREDFDASDLARLLRELGD